LSFEPQVNHQVISHEPSRLSNGRFARGHSGNPHGPKVYLERQAASKAHAAELLKALAAELGGKLSAVDLAFASQAAAMLAKAHYSEKHRVHLTTKAGAIIDRLRARYPAKKRLPSLRELGL
jgi:hypothetical protein